MRRSVNFNLPIVLLVFKIDYKLKLSCPFYRPVFDVIIIISKLNGQHSILRQSLTRMHLSSGGSTHVGGMITKGLGKVFLLV